MGGDWLSSPAVRGYICIESCLIIVYNPNMKFHLRWLLIATMVFLVGGFFVWRSSYAQQGRSEFPETGHVLRGTFYRAYWSIENPLLLYGYPITDPTIDPTTGKVVQYFERAVFVLNKDQIGFSQVDLAPLGKYLYEPGEYSIFLDNPVECTDFSDIGYQVCHSFREFYDTYGGRGQFGLPVSNLEIQNGRIVQYFERARFDWYPELPPGERVRLGNLGKEYFDVIGEDPDKLRSNKLSYDILDVVVQASPSKPVAFLKDEQTVYVLVQDQNHQPVYKARVEVLVTWPSGREEIYKAEPTDEKGLTKVSFPVNSTVSGHVLLRATAGYGKFISHATSSFRAFE